MRSGGSLRRWLASECLDQATYTGDFFSKLVQELNRGGDSENPYRLSMEEIEQRTVAVAQQMAQLQERVRQLWNYLPPKFTFSANLKHQGITLSEGKTRAVDSGGWFNVLVEPAVSMTTISKISFKINKLSHLMVGLCYKNVVQQKGYSASGLLGSGLYALYLNGNDRVMSHSRKEDDGKHCPVHFETGNIITVELDPVSGRVTYSKEGFAPFLQETSIRSTSKEPVHFCLAMAILNDVSILP